MNGDVNTPTFSIPGSVPGDVFNGNIFSSIWKKTQKLNEDGNAQSSFKIPGTIQFGK